MTFWTNLGPKKKSFSVLMNYSDATEEDVLHDTPSGGNQ